MGEGVGHEEGVGHKEGIRHEGGGDEAGHEKGEEGERRGEGFACEVLGLLGAQAKTTSGLTKDGLTKNKNGKVVSKKMSAQSKKRYANSPIKAWANAVKAARKALGVSGFVAIGGKSAAGKALYSKAKSLM